MKSLINPTQIPVHPLQAKPTLSAQIIVRTDDGRNVLLKSDGTWEYYDQPVFTSDFQEFKGTNIPTYSDPDSVLIVRIHKIYIGDIIAKKGFMHQLQIEDMHNLGKEVIFYDISIENYKGTDYIFTNYLQFLLEDNESYSYKSMSVDSDIQVNSNIYPSKKIRGGICFGINEGNVPDRIVFDPEVKLYFGSHKKKVMIFADGLSKLEIFTNDHHKK